MNDDDKPYVVRQTEVARVSGRTHTRFAVYMRGAGGQLLGHLTRIDYHRPTWEAFDLSGKRLGANETKARAAGVVWACRVPCGATDWATCDDGHAHVYGICDLLAHRTGRHVQRSKDGTLWAEWSGDSGPVPYERCEHMLVSQP